MSNKMELATDNCSTIMIRGDENPFRLNEQRLTISNDAQDLGITVSKKLTWTVHVNLRMKKANGVL